MLHAKDDLAFIMACEHGHLKLAEWLWSICPDEEQSAMLHANDDSAFRLACGYGHLGDSKLVMEYLFRTRAISNVTCQR